MDYFNTIPLDGQELTNAEQTAEEQNRQVYNLFLSVKQPMTPWTASDLMGGSMLITSVRRAINRLTTKGLLIKTDIKQMERMGSKNNLWALSDTNEVKTAQTTTEKKERLKTAKNSPKINAAIFDLTEQLAAIGFKLYATEAESNCFFNDNLKLAEAVKVAHAEIEKLQRQVKQKSYEYQVLLDRYDEVNSELKKLKSKK